MKVILAANWFSPTGSRYRKRDNPVEIPDELFKFLPKSAKVVKADAPAVKAEKAPETLSAAAKKLFGTGTAEEAHSALENRAADERAKNKPPTKDQFAVE